MLVMFVMILQRQIVSATETATTVYEKDAESAYVYPNVWLLRAFHSRPLGDCTSSGAAFSSTQDLVYRQTRYQKSVQIVI